MNNYHLDDDDKEMTPAAAPTTLIENALFKSRTILLTGGIDFKAARSVCERLLALSAESNDPILLVISSPGGHVESGDMIHDMIKFVSAPVKVLGTGWVASAGAHIFLGARKENRLCLPNTRFLLHQPAGGVRGQASDIEIEAEEIIKMQERVNRMIALETGQTYEKVVKDTLRNFWMSADEAVAYGLVSKVITDASEV
jgi:ATP-dependent Clp protease protease subunit